MRFLVLISCALASANALAMRLGAKLQVNEAPPKIWVIELKDDKAWESRTEGKLGLRFNMEPGKKGVVIHVEITEAGEKSAQQLAKMDVKAKWGKTATVIEAVNGTNIRLFLRPSKR